MTTVAIFGGTGYAGGAIRDEAAVHRGVLTMAAAGRNAEGAGPDQGRGLPGTVTRTRPFPGPPPPRAALPPSVPPSACL